MTTPAGDPTLELSTFCTAMSGYFSGLKANFLDPTQTLPMFGDIPAQFDYSNLLSSSLALGDKSQNFTTAAVTDSVHAISSVIREFGMRTSSKYDYFLSAQTDADTDANYYQAFSARYGSSMRGTNPDAK
jgi:hypothetical protein